MPGNREFQQIVAAAPREVLKTYRVQSVVDVSASGGSEVIDIYASDGCIARVVSAFISYPAVSGATSGNHTAGLTTTAQTGGILSGGSNFGSVISLNDKCFNIADLADSQFPSTHEGQTLALTTSSFDDTVGLRMVYTNNTDAAQTGLRTYGVTYIERTRGD